MQGCASLPRTNDRKLVLMVIDGLTPSVFEYAAESGDTPALSFLARRGSYRRALSTFPSLTPVCASSIATGTHADVHRIPHLVWYHRGEQRLIEYGSSFGALKAAGTRRSIIDTIFHMNGRHLGAEATTVFEALDDAGLVTAAINFTCYRGPHGAPHHAARRRRAARAGPQRFFFYNLFESDETGAPLAVRNRSGGSIDEYATAVGRWLVTRDGFDFLLFYLSDYDYASHALGPEGAAAKLADADRAIGALLEAAGGPDEFLERYDVILCSDHGQTTVGQASPLESAYVDLRIFRGRQLRGDVAVCASNRAGQVYRLPGCNEDVRRLAERLDGHEAVDTVLFREDGHVVARRERRGAALPPGQRRVRARRRRSLLDDHPDALTRAWAALANPNAGDVLVSAAAGLRVHGPRRSPSRRRGKPRLALRRVTRRCRCSPSDLPPRRRASRRSPRPCSPISVSADARRRMVAEQLRAPRHLGRARAGGDGARAARAVRAGADRERACDDAALPIGQGQTISQPYMVARICEALAAGPHDRVLDVGTGSGYQAAVLAELAGEVHTIERIPELAEQARGALAAAGYERVRVHVGDGTLGLPDVRAVRRDRRCRSRA